MGDDEIPDLEPTYFQSRIAIKGKRVETRVENAPVERINHEPIRGERGVIGQDDFGFLPSGPVALSSGNGFQYKQEVPEGERKTSQPYQILAECKPTANVRVSPIAIRERAAKKAAPSIPSRSISGARLRCSGE
jgi:hypothetical protein